MNTLLQYANQPKLFNHKNYRKYLLSQQESHNKINEMKTKTLRIEYETTIKEQYITAKNKKKRRKNEKETTC